MYCYPYFYGDAVVLPGDIPIPDVPDDTDTRRKWRWLRIFTVITMELEALDYLRQFRPIVRILLRNVALR